MWVIRRPFLVIVDQFENRLVYFRPRHDAVIAVLELLHHQPFLNQIEDLEKEVRGVCGERFIRGKESI